MKYKELAIFLLMGNLFLTGCGASDSVSAAESTSNVTEVAVKTISDNTSNKDTSDMFTERDEKINYDEESSSIITLADDKSSCNSDAVEIAENTITITDEGTYILSGKLTNGMIIIDAQDTDKVQLVLEGAEVTSAESAAIYVRSADKVFITTASGSENILTNGGTYTPIDDNNIDAVIFSKDDLTLNGAGILTINAAAGHAVVSKDDLVLTSGTYNITAEKHGLSGKDSVRIADGTYHITSGKDGIHASNTDDSSLGFIYIEGGDFEITAEDDGMHADSALTVKGGTIHVAKSYEGIEGLSIDITGGNINVTSSDDGLNAAGGNDSSGFEGGGGDIFAVEEGAYIHIAGGTLHVNASGDGIDSNGDLEISGGETYVSGPTDGANGSLDYNGEGKISGGIFVTAGSSGMAQNLSDSSSQGVILTAVDAQTAGSTISLMDSSKNELVSWTADKEYAFVVVSCPEITLGETYTLTAGSSSQEITMDSLIYGTGGMGGHPGGHTRGQNRPMKDGEAPRQGGPMGEQQESEL
ncbi:MAG: carbohydrate-binding domain-containing protein [Eubacteriales bacterium]|nr:carbohydrate-binding domain-containing protein [Eubacteriales bacterium]